MRLIRVRDGAVLLTQVQWCTSFLSRLRGLMFRRTLAAGAGIVLVEGRESRLDTAIHMLFMFFPIATVWLNANYQVVDKCLAKPWRLFYASQKPAKYVIEANPQLLDKISLGDTLRFEE